MFGNRAALMIAIVTALSGLVAWPARAQEATDGPGGLDGKVTEAIRDTVSASRGYRLAFPDGSAVDEARQPRRGPRRERGASGLPSEGLSALARVVLWLAAIVAAVLLAFWIVRQWLGYVPAGPRVGAALPGVEVRPVAAGGSEAAPPDEELDPLVERGDFAAAIHLLLRRALRQVNGATDPPPALTARAALRHLPRSAQTRAALSVLVEAVERTRYAGLVPDAELVMRCRAASEAL